MISLLLQIKVTALSEYLYLTNSKKFKMTADKLHQAEGRLAQLEEEWLALEIKREELEGF